ncbi:uncharacterized protein EV420DRAFT_1594357, partial [Desarmillaria tabescens]
MPRDGTVMIPREGAWNEPISLHVLDQRGLFYLVRFCSVTQIRTIQCGTHKCRCDGVYAITDKQMELGHHFVACSSCSEVIWVEYKFVGQEEVRRGSLVAVFCRLMSHRL